MVIIRNEHNFFTEVSEDVWMHISNAQTDYQVPPYQWNAIVLGVKGKDDTAGHLWSTRYIRCCAFSGSKWVLEPDLINIED